MKSNQFFSFGRFYRLLRNDILLNYKKYILTCIVAFIVGSIFIYFQMTAQMYKGIGFQSYDYNIMFFMCIYGLVLVIGCSFPELNNKDKTRSYLLLPSSTFEKYFSQFTIYFVAGLIIFLIFFWVDSYIARSVALKFADPDQPSFISKFDFSMIFTKSERQILYILKIVNMTVKEISGFIFKILSVSMYLFSVKIFFRKLAFIKSVISLVVLLYAFYLIMIILSIAFNPSIISFKVNIDDYQVTPTFTNNEIFFYVIGGLSWLFFLPLGYFKLKEKQV